MRTNLMQNLPSQSLEHKRNTGRCRLSSALGSKSHVHTGKTTTSGWVTAAAAHLTFRGCLRIWLTLVYSCTNTHTSKHLDHHPPLSPPFVQYASHRHPSRRRGRCCYPRGCRAQAKGWSACHYIKQKKAHISPLRFTSPTQTTTASSCPPHV